MTPPEHEQKSKPCWLCGSPSNSFGLHNRKITYLGCSGEHCPQINNRYESDLWNSAYCWKKIDQLEEENKNLKMQKMGFTQQEVMEKCRVLETKLTVAREALKKISKVTQFDHPQSQIISSEEYEGAWLDCLDIAQQALSRLNEGKGE